MKVQSFYSIDVFDTLQNEWNELLKRSITDTPFSSIEWHSNWWNAYQPGALWVLTVRDESDTLHGIAPFFIADVDGQRILHFIGCVDVTDYVDLLVDRDHATVVYEAIVDSLIEHQELYDTIDLCNIPSESATYQTFPALLEAKGFSVKTKVQEVCPLIELPNDFDSYVEALEKKQRKEIQRKLRRAKGAGDSLNWYTVTDEHNLDEEIDKFLKLMAASHPEKAQFLENEQHVTFFKSIVPAAMQAGWLDMNFLEVVGEPVAAYVNFDYNNEILVYNSGLEPNKAAALSPGIILLSYNIEHAIQNERTVFNFLRGNETYKYKMGGHDTEIYNLQASL